MGQFSNLLVALKLNYLVIAGYVGMLIWFYFLTIKNPKQKIAQMRAWPTTKGKITQVKTTDVNLNNSINYEYEVDKKPYQGEKLSCLILFFRDKAHTPPEIAALLEKEPKVGQEIDVIYNPQNPQESYLIRVHELPKQVMKQFTFLLILGVITIFLFI